MSGLLLALALAQTALGNDAALAVEEARVALEGGAALTARQLATAALSQQSDLDGWSIYLHGSRATGLGPMVQAEMDALAAQDGQIRVFQAEIAVRDEELALDALRELAGEFPDPGQVSLATLLWDREAKPGVLALTPDDPNSEEVTRLRLRVTTATGESRVAGVVARAWMRNHPEAPDVLAELWGPAPEEHAHGPIRRRALSWLRKSVASRGEDPLFLHRALTVFRAAGDQVGEDDVRSRLVRLGHPPPPPTHAELHRQAVKDSDALRRAQDFDGALAVWEALRARSDGADAALEHARYLQVLERYPEAFEVALQARSLAAGPTADDLACLDTAAHAARMADAHGLVAELALALARTRTAREGAAAAHALDPHPRWTALLAQAEVLPDNPGDSGLPVDVRVRAVLDTLVDPTLGEAWVTRAEQHEAAGETHAAFMAWVLARAYQAPVNGALQRTWDGVGDAEVAAAGALEAFHAARRGHRDAIAAIRDAGPSGSPIEHAFVAPGPGLMLPSWEAVDAEGGQVGSRTLQGKPYVLSVWASWCTPCLLELPALNERVASMRSPVRAVAISVDERETVFRRRVRDEGWTDLTLGWNPELTTTLGVDGLPTSFVIDGAGRIVHVERGYSPQGVDRLLGQLESAQ